jgi:hypothetical protein
MGYFTAARGTYFIGARLAAMSSDQINALAQR